jgi:capsular polysaccharide export protein
MCGLRGYDCTLICKTSNDIVPRKLVFKTIEYLNCQFDEYDCHVYLNSVVEALCRMPKPQRVVVWNGQHIVGRAVEFFCDTYKVQSQYLELSNLPMSVFSDPIGVNANSSVCLNPSIIDSLPDVSTEVHEMWLDNYKEYKKGKIPQAVNGTGKKLLSLLNAVLKKAYPSVLGNKISFLKKKNNIVVSNVRSIGDEPIPPDSRYVFLPLQVSGDTQIKLHSPVNNIQAINIALETAEANNAILVVKIHPAETDQDLLSQLVDLKSQKPFILSSKNTVELILSADTVVTINSTVGLESLLLGKKTVVLGRALYKDFDQARLRKYIHHYLVNGIDYFSKDDIEYDAAAKAVGL